MKPTSLILVVPAAALLCLLAASCGEDSERRATIRAFYDANDSGRFDEALSLLEPDSTLDIWAQAINGNHLGQRHLVGREAIRPFLDGKGLRRNPYGDEGPFFREVDVAEEAGRVNLWLRPDRKAPDGRSYDSFKAEFIVEGSRIKSLTIVDIIGWL